MLRTCKKCGGDMVSYGNQGRFRCPHCAKNYLRKWYAKNYKGKDYPIINCKSCGKPYKPFQIKSVCCSDACRDRYKYSIDKDFRKRKLLSGKTWAQKNIVKSRKIKKKWKDNNPEAIREKARRLIVNLGNCYVAQKLRGQGIKNPPQELIELKRKQLQLKRLYYEKQKSGS